jgi:UDP-N-acetyl-D-mannosaminuronic acid dehydrogenase
MKLNDLQARISSRKAKLAVIGLGYVGLPVACRFAEAGFDLVGVEANRDRLLDIQAGTLPFSGHEPGLADLLTTVIAGNKFSATSDYGLLTDRDVILICVETPVDDANIPQYQALRSALTGLGPVLKPGALVIIESTLAPGTMQNLVLPLLEQSSGVKVNDGFYLGVCPERVMPGKLLANLRSVSRVVGGMTPETAETIALLYRAVVEAELDKTDCVTAELVKTVENAYRDVQIAFANEVALICAEVGGDVWAVRELVNKSPGRQMLLPGAGVGGHCIPKDPWLLAYAVHDKDVPLKLIPAARTVNNSMPEKVLELVQEALAARGLGLSGAKILILGYSYLEESDDTRNSPSENLVKRLLGQGAVPIIHDPFVREYRGSPVEMASGCDAAVLMVRHHVYRGLNLQTLHNSLRTPILVDGRGLIPVEEVRSAGLDYWGIGVGRSP